VDIALVVERVVKPCPHAHCTRICDMRMNSCLHGSPNLTRIIRFYKTAPDSANLNPLLPMKNGRADPLPCQTLEFVPTCGLPLSLGRASGKFCYFPGSILMVARLGLRPLRAFLCETENVPKPINATRSPFLKAEVMLSTLVSIAWMPGLC